LEATVPLPPIDLGCLGTYDPDLSPHLQPHAVAIHRYLCPLGDGYFVAAAPATVATLGADYQLAVTFDPGLSTEDPTATLSGLRRLLPADDYRSALVPATPYHGPYLLVSHLG
jgi:hypothetical protein